MSIPPPARSCRALTPEYLPGQTLRHERPAGFRHQRYSLGATGAAGCSTEKASCLGPAAGATHQVRLGDVEELAIATSRELRSPSGRAKRAHRRSA